MLFEYGFKLENTSNKPLVIYSIADQTDHFANAFIRKNVAYSYDVLMFKSLQSTPFC